MKLIVRWLLTALALLGITHFVTGIRVDNFYAALVAALVLGLVNALIRPVILLLTLPFNIITLGLFTLVVNALMFWFASTVVKGFNVDGFLPAFWGAILMWVFNWFINGIMSSRRKDQ